MKKKISFFALFICTIFAVCLTTQVMAQEPIIKPLLPEPSGDIPENTGFIGPRVDLSHITGTNMPDHMVTLDPPERYDWREQGKVTAVKNQGGCGSCYAFASIANFESKLLMDGESIYNLSENNAKECNYYDRSCNGGNFYQVADLFSKSGTVLESCDPYTASDVSCNSSCAYQQVLLGWNIISNSSVPLTSVLKNYVFTYGPVYTTLYAGNGDAFATEYATYDGSYVLHYTGSESPNHAVLIVGWDDTLSHAGGTGAWIVKNSWGTGWGGTCDYGTESGYFYIAYGSANIGMSSSFISAWQDYDASGELLYYDEGGFTNSVGYGSTSGWGLSEFTTTSDVYVHRVEFWTSDVTTDVDVYIYDDFNGSTLSNLLESKLDNSFDEAGYHSVLLDDPLQVTSGNSFYVAVRFTNETDGYPIVFDGVGPNETGKTYISYTGSSWTDMGSTYGSDVAIRVRTHPSLIVSAEDEFEQVPDGFELSYNYPNPFNPKTVIEYSIPTGRHVELAVYNLLGQKVTTLVDEYKDAGEYTVSWNGTNSDGEQISSGVYFYQLNTGEETESKKMLLLK